MRSTRTPRPTRPCRRCISSTTTPAAGASTTRAPTGRRSRNKCAPYDGPTLPYFVAGCKAPDGSYWAIQSWQRALPLLGFDPWKPQQTAFELHLSHWSGELPKLEVYGHWTYGGAWQGLFGRLTYGGSPVHGFGATGDGNPRDRYGRNVYIDTFNSVYGAGWKRESGILVHRPTGTFCHSFVPQKPFPGLPEPGDAPGSSRGALPRHRDGPRRHAGDPVGGPWAHGG